MTLAYISVVDEDEERCKRNDLGQTIAGQSYFDADLQQTTHSVNFTYIETTHSGKDRTQSASTAITTVGFC